jgi:tRNA pseudouridine38-40 synthase
MAEDTGTATPGIPTKRHCVQDARQSAESSPKRVKVDMMQQPATVGASPAESNTDVPQGSSKSPKRRDAAGYPKSRHGKEKHGKNLGRKRRSRPERNEEAGAGAGAEAAAAEADPRDDAPEKAPRLPKRQSAILLGFCGTGCAGMQMWVG